MAQASRGGWPGRMPWRGRRVRPADRPCPACRWPAAHTSVEDPHRTRPVRARSRRPGVREGHPWVTRSARQHDWQAIGHFTGGLTTTDGLRPLHLGDVG